MDALRNDSEGYEPRPIARFAVDLKRFRSVWIIYQCVSDFFGLARDEDLQRALHFQVFNLPDHLVLTALKSRVKTVIHN